MTRKSCRSIASFVLAGLIALAPIAPMRAANPAPSQNPPAAQAQAQVQGNIAQGFTVPAGPDFTRPKPAFPHFLAPYTPIQLDEPQYVNAPQINQLIQNGK